MRENEFKTAASRPAVENGGASEYGLILAARNNDENAFDQLYKRYLPVVFWCVSSFSPPVSEKDDLVQEGVIGLLKAIRTYDNVSSSFQTYASLCIKRSIISALRKYNRSSRLVYSADLSENPSVVENNDSISTEREDGRQLCMRFIKELSPFEKKTLTLYISGMPYSSMAEKLGCSVKSVDNAITRIKLKIKHQKAKHGNTPD